MGGAGTWDFASRYPHRVAAIAPICGWTDEAQAAYLKHVPVWAFHGAQDDIVPLRESQVMVNAVTNAGGDARLTIYPQAGHDSWTETYANPELYDWLLLHKRVVRRNNRRQG